MQWYEGSVKDSRCTHQLFLRDVFCHEHRLPYTDRAFTSATLPLSSPCTPLLRTPYSHIPGEDNHPGDASNPMDERTVAAAAAAKATPFQLMITWHEAETEISSTLKAAEDMGFRESKNTRVLWALPGVVCVGSSGTASRVLHATRSLRKASCVWLHIDILGIPSPVLHGSSAAAQRHQTLCRGTRLYHSITPSAKVLRCLVRNMGVGTAGYAGRMWLGCANLGMPTYGKDFRESGTAFGGNKAKAK